MEVFSVLTGLDLDAMGGKGGKGAAHEHGDGCNHEDDHEKEEQMKRE
jgi:stress-induced-phosphoprotein 1